MSKVNQLSQDEMERRFEALRLQVMNDCHEYNLHPDDDHEAIDEIALDLLRDETGEWWTP